jgi:hypothetical protein
MDGLLRAPRRLIEGTLAGFRRSFDLLPCMDCGSLRAASPFLALRDCAVETVSCGVGDEVAGFFTRARSEEQAKRCAHRDSHCENTDCFWPSIS